MPANHRRDTVLRARMSLDVLEGDKAAMTGWRRLRPDGAYSRQVVVRARTTIGKGYAESAELGLQVASTDAKDQAPAREFIQTGLDFVQEDLCLHPWASDMVHSIENSLL